MGAAANNATRCQPYRALTGPDSVGDSWTMALMAKLDVDWAINEIDQFLHVTAQVGYNNRPGSGVSITGTHMRGGETEASQRAHVVEQVLA